MRSARKMAVREARSPYGGPARRSRANSDVVSNQALQKELHRLSARFTIGARNDASELEASRAAASFAPGVRSRDQGSLIDLAAPIGGPLASAIDEPGAPLEGGVRADMEEHFGVPLGDVRVHAGPKAGRLADSLGASAFTHGRDIVFGKGRKPNSDALTAQEGRMSCSRAAAVVPSGCPLARSLVLSSAALPPAMACRRACSRSTYIR